MRAALIFSLILLGIGNAFARDSKSANMEIIVDGTDIPTYSHKGKTYIEAIKGKEYSIRIYNPLEERVAVALSVDGLNTIDAKQTKPQKAAKWMLEPYQSIVISGWQVNDRQARQFFFTTEEKSYGAKLGKTENLGVISAAFFKERHYSPPVYMGMGGMSGGMAGMGGMGGRGGGMGMGGMGGMGGGMGGMGMGGGMGGMGGGMSGGMGGGMRGLGTAPGAPKAGPIVSEAPKAQSSPSSVPEYAATGMGNRVDHKVENVRLDLEDKPFATINLRYEFRSALIKLKVPLSRPDKKPPLLRRVKGSDD
jgi:hypothetical protein